MTRLRILLNSLNYQPEPTGIGKYSAEMARWLAERGHEVDVVAAPPYYPQWRIYEGYRGRGFTEEVLDGVRVHRAPLYLSRSGRVATRARLAAETSFTGASGLTWARLGLARERFDVVVAVIPPLQSALWPAAYALSRSTPLIIHVQDLQVDAAMRLGFFRRYPFLSRLLYGVEAALLRRASLVTSVTGKMCERIVAKGIDPSRVAVFPNWADTEAIRPLPAANRFRAELGLSETDVLVQYAGNMGAKQGLGLVLDAAEAVAGQPGIAFGLWGDGAAKDDLVREVRRRKLDRVRVFPLVSWAEVPELLAAGDIHLVPQRSEAADLLMPSKVGNILAAGRPFVATCDPDTALGALARESGAGVATPPGDAGALARAVSELASSRDRRAAMGVRGRAYAERRLAKTPILQAFERTLVELARSGGVAAPSSAPGAGRDGAQSR